MRRDNYGPWSSTCGNLPLHSNTELSNLTYSRPLHSLYTWCLNQALLIYYRYLLKLFRKVFSLRRWKYTVLKSQNLQVLLKWVVFCAKTLVCFWPCDLNFFSYPILLTMFQIQNEKMNPSTSTSAGVSLNFDAQALHNQEEAEYEREEQLREREVSCLSILKNMCNKKRSSETCGLCNNIE